MSFGIFALPLRLVAGCFVVLLFLLKLLQIGVKVAAGLEHRLQDGAEGRRVAETNVPLLFGLVRDLSLGLDLDRAAGTELEELTFQT